MTVKSIDMQGNIIEVPVESLKWRPSAYGITLKDNCILLSPQTGNTYDLPGGGIDLGEAFEDAVIRETKEETGLDVTSPKLLDLRTSFFSFDHQGDDSFQTIMMYYVCDFVGGELSTAGFDEHEKHFAKLAEWVQLSKLKDIKIASSVDWREIVYTYANIGN